MRLLATHPVLVILMQEFSTQLLKHFRAAYTVISGVTDLLVVTDNQPSSGTPDLKKAYHEGLVATGELAYGSLGHLKVLKGFDLGALDEIKHILLFCWLDFPCDDARNDRVLPKLYG